MFDSILLIQSKTKDLITGFGFSPGSKIGEASFESQQLVPVLNSHTALWHCSVSVSLCFCQTHYTAAVVLSTYMFTAQRSLLLEALTSHSGKYRILLSEAKIDSAGGEEVGTQELKLTTPQLLEYKLEIRRF